MKIKLLFISLIAMAFVGCFDTTETYTINEDGSGLFHQKIDFSRTITGIKEMAESMGKETNKKAEQKDSTFYYKHFIDTVTTLSAEEKDAVRNAYGKLHVNEANNEMNIEMYYPFKNAAQFLILQKVISKNNEEYNLLKKIIAELRKAKLDGMPNLNELTEESEKPKKEIPPVYIYTFTNNQFVRIKNKDFVEISDAPTQSEDMPEQLKELMKTNITTIINLPRPIKKYTAQNATMSVDKKNIRISNQFDLGEKPKHELFEFNIEY